MSAKRIFIGLFVIWMALVPSFSRVQAQIPVTDFANIGNQWVIFLQQKLLDELKEAFEKAAKLAVIKIVIDKMGELISGDGKPLFITDPYDHLFDQPEQIALEAMEQDFFRVTTRGRTASGVYEATISSDGISYEASLENIGRIAISGQNGTPEVNIHAYCNGDPRGLFTNNEDFRCFNSFISNPLNNPLGYRIIAQRAFEEELARQEAVALNEARTGDGFLGVKNEDGLTITPPSIVRDLQAGVSKLPLDSLAASDDGLLATALQSVIVSLLISTIQNGIGTVNGDLQINSDTTFSFTGQLGERIQDFGPGANFDPYGDQFDAIDLRIPALGQ